MWRKGEYRLFFELRQGREVVAATEDFLLKDTTPREKSTIKGKLLYTEADTQIVVRGARCEWVLDKVDGTVRSWVVKGKSFLIREPDCPSARKIAAGFRPKRPGNRVSVYLKGAQTQQLTFYRTGPEGGIGPAEASVLPPAKERSPIWPPGGGQTGWEGTEGLQTETSWLRCKPFGRCRHPFLLPDEKGQTSIFFDGSLVLTPKKTKQNYYE